MEDTRIEQLLQENLQMTKETALELRKIRKEMRWLSAFRIIVWLILAGVPVFFYLHILKPAAFWLGP
jgi:hypothetical protein